MITWSHIHAWNSLSRDFVFLGLFLPGMFLQSRKACTALSMTFTSSVEKLCAHDHAIWITIKKALRFDMVMICKGHLVTGRRARFTHQSHCWYSKSRYMDRKMHTCKSFKKPLILYLLRFTVCLTFNPINFEENTLPWIY